MTQIATHDPHRIEPPHFPEDDDKLAQLTESMRRDGWIGAEVVVIDRDDADPWAITGSHRIAAAREAGVDVPTIRLADLFAEHGASLADLIADYEAAGFHRDDAAHEVAIRATDYLPANVIDHYGLDPH